MRLCGAVRGSLHRTRTLLLALSWFIHDLRR